MAAHTCSADRVDDSRSAQDLPLWRSDDHVRSLCVLSDCLSTCLPASAEMMRASGSDPVVCGACVMKCSACITSQLLWEICGASTASVMTRQTLRLQTLRACRLCSCRAIGRQTECQTIAPARHAPAPVSTRVHGTEARAGLSVMADCGYLAVGVSQTRTPTHAARLLAAT